MTLLTFKDPGNRTLVLKRINTAVPVDTEFNALVNALAKNYSRDLPVYPGPKSEGIEYLGVRFVSPDGLTNGRWITGPDWQYLEDLESLKTQSGD